ncbi:hypothetical protein [Haloprofundus halobius]|uniref:hypothetical protein n=1 Tax=Haloprofundus halobius TaxID=2876194 RepID=UPI001CCAB7FE|nr:hypothetical protein [Haloprofundus halobius]
MPNEDGMPRKTTREKLIEAAQIRVHEERVICLRANLRFNTVPRSKREDFQTALLDYYHALRPLRKEGIVNNFWENEVLSKKLTQPTEVEQQNVKAQIDGGKPTISTETVSVDKPIEGLDWLEELEDETETNIEEQRTMRGTLPPKRTERPLVLPADVLIDIAGVLDDAAARLGFSPEVALQEGTTDPV